MTIHHEGRNHFDLGETIARRYEGIFTLTCNRVIDVTFIPEFRSESNWPPAAAFASSLDWDHPPDVQTARWCIAVTHDVVVTPRGDGGEEVLLERFDPNWNPDVVVDGKEDVLLSVSPILHSEMFPLLDSQEPNPLELFQIWLNLPSSDKRVEPYFSMLWSHTLARHTATDEAGRSTEITIVAGRFGDTAPPAPPPNSWAARPDTDVAIWTISMAPRARFTLPRARTGTNRSLYFFRGESLVVGGREIHEKAAIKVRSDADATIENGAERSELLLLQGKPMGEPVVQYGPFVMNSRAEIQQAILDYQRTSFGGWPWPNHGPVHAKDAGRFAKHADGRIERAG